MVEEILLARILAGVGRERGPGGVGAGAGLFAEALGGAGEGELDLPLEQRAELAQARAGPAEDLATIIKATPRSLPRTR